MPQFIPSLIKGCEDSFQFGAVTDKKKNTVNISMPALVFFFFFFLFPWVKYPEVRFLGHMVSMYLTF